MANTNVNISNRLLTYVKHGIDVTQDMKNIYSNSMILIGDEKQIYVPVLNAYVGVGESRFSQVEEIVNRITDINFKDTIIIPQPANINTDYFTYAVNGIVPVDADNPNEFKITYSISAVPTKKYVDKAIADSKIELSGSYTANGKVVLTNAYLYNGVLSYTYSNLSTSTSGTKNTLGVSVDTTGQLTNLLNPDNVNKGIDVITGIKTSQNGLETVISYTYTKIYASKDHHSSSGDTKPASHVVTNVKLETGGKLSYSTADLSGDYYLQHNAFITYIHQGANGKITSVSGNHFVDIYNEETAGKLTTDPAHKQRIVTDTYLSTTGELTITYKDIFTDITDFTYHNIELVQITPQQNTTEFTYAIVGITTSNNDIASSKHTISYSTLAVPTKKYVDDKISLSQITLTNTGKSDVNNSVVITSTYLSSTGDYSYTYSNLTASVAGISYTLNPSGKQSLSNILNPDNVNKGIDVITGIKVTTDKLETKISYTYTSLYASKDHHSTKSVHDANTSTTLITNVNLSIGGELSYTTVSLTGEGSKPKGFLRSFKQDSLGHVTVSGKEFANIHTRSEAHKLATSKSNADKYVSYAYISEDGELKVSYSYLYVDPQNDFKYHEFSVIQQASIDDNNFVYVVNGINTSYGGNATSHTLSYNLVGVPTKEYVDDLIVANDAMRYRGTVIPASSLSGNITLSYDTTKYSTADVLTGAVYKVSASGYIGSAYVVPGDMIISYMDPASINSATGWNIINENVNLRTATPSKSVNSNGTNRVLTNVSLNNTGTLSYTYAELAVSTNTATISNIGEIRTKQSASVNYNINTSDLNKGFPVITSVSLSQDGVTTKLSYSYSYIYAGVDHHSTGTAANSGTTVKLTYGTASNLVTSVSLSTNGQLQYTYSPVIVETAFSSTYATYSTYSAGIDSIIRSGDTTSGVITNIFIDDNKKLNISYTNLHSGSDANAGFLKSFTQSITGKVTAYTGNFSMKKNTGKKNLSEGSYDFVTAVNLDNTGKLTYDLITVSVTDSYTYNKTLTTNGTIINITGTIGADGSRTWSYMTPSHLYSYISGTNTYTFLQNGKIGQKLTVGGHIEGKGTLEIYGNTILGSNATTTYAKVHGRLIVEQNFYTYGSSYLGNNGSDNTVVTGNLSVSENTTVTKNLTVDGNTTLGNDTSNVTIVKGDLKVNGNTYIGDASSDIVYINSKKINLENNAITLEFIGLKAIWGTIS